MRPRWRARPAVPSKSQQVEEIRATVTDLVAQLRAGLTSLQTGLAVLEGEVDEHRAGAS